METAYEHGGSILAQIGSVVNGWLVYSTRKSVFERHTAHVMTQMKLCSIIRKMRFSRSPWAVEGPVLSLSPKDEGLAMSGISGEVQPMGLEKRGAGKCSLDRSLTRFGLGGRGWQAAQEEGVTRATELSTISPF